MLFCPTCGAEERQPSQFCRGCGTDMRAIRVTLERPDDVTVAAVSAREQIGRVFAEKIREAEGSKDLKRIAEDVLPQIEKFLESPQEKRLRTARAGVVTAAVGVGAAVLALLLLTVAISPEGISLLTGAVGLSVVVFMIGVGLVFNAMILTTPRKQLPSPDLAPEQLAENFPAPTTAQLLNETPALSVPSVTEHTTKHLGRK